MANSDSEEEICGGPVGEKAATWNLTGPHKIRTMFANMLQQPANSKTECLPQLSRCLHGSSRFVACFKEYLC